MGINRQCLVMTDGGDPCLPRLLWVGLRRKPRPTYRVDTRGTAPGWGSLDIGIAGEGAWWEDPDAAAWRPIPPDHALLVVGGESGLAYGTPPAATRAWDFLYIGVGGDPALALLRRLIARGGRVQPLSAADPALRALRQLVPADGHATRRLDAARSAQLALAPLLALWSRQPVPVDAGLVRRAQDLLLAELGGGASAARAALRLGVGRARLARAFAAAGLPPPATWLRAQRLLLAETLLRGSDLGLAAIARRCGLAGASQLVRLFVRERGITPGRFRTGG